MELLRHYISDLHSALDQISPEILEHVVTVLHEARLKYRRIFIMGNGGSSSTASHFACDLGKNTRFEGWPNFMVMGLTDNMALLSAYANDEGYENVFVQQLASFVRQGDVVIGISTSGNSPNVIKAIRFAKKVQALTIGFTGFDGGQLGSLVDIHVHVKSCGIEQVEDIHLMLEHVICKALREMNAQPIVLDQENIFLPDPFRIIADPLTEEFLSREGYSRDRRNEAFFDLLFETDRENQSVINMEAKPFQRLLELSLEGVEASSGSIITLDNDGYLTEAVLAYAGEIRVHSNNLKDYSKDQFSEILQHGLAGWVVANQRPALVHNTREDPRWLKRTWDDLNGSRSIISVPLMRPEKVFGVLTLAKSSTSQFNQDDLILLSAVALGVSAKH